MASALTATTTASPQSDADRVKADKAFKLLRDHPDLPSPGGVALEIMRLSRSPDCRLADLAKVIQTDPAIVSRLLRVVNSSAYPHSRPIVAVSEAVAYLGTRMVECIALSFSLISGKPSCPAFDYTAFWSDSLARAVAAGKIAIEMDVCHPDELFTAGLLSQIGRLTFATLHPDEYNTLLTSIQCEPRELNELERVLFDIDHNDLASRMLTDWGLPTILCQAVSVQDDFASASGSENEISRLATVLALAGSVAQRVTGHHPTPPTFPEIAGLAARVGLDIGATLEIIKATIPQWQEMLGLFEIGSLGDLQIKRLHAEAAELRKKLAEKA